MATDVAAYIFETPGPARLSLSSIRGEVFIRASAQPSSTMRIQVVKHTGSGDAENTQIEVVQEDDGLVRVETRFREHISGLGWLSGLLGGGHPCRVTYTVDTPADCSVNLRCVSSDAEVTGLQGDLKFDTVSGDLSLNDLQGEITGKTVSGDVKARGITSRSLKLDSVSGDLKFESSRLEAVRGKTISGDIRLETPLAGGDYRFSTISGSVRLIVPRDTRCSLEASSLSGAIHSSLPVTRTESGRRKRMDVQGGGTRIELHSTSGDLYLTTSSEFEYAEDDVPAAQHDFETQAHYQAQQETHSASNPEPVSVPLSRQEILDRIERGELSVEDAIRLLQS
jgi:hypothetical protein